MWSSLEQRGVGLLSEMEGMASQNFEKYFKRSPNLEQIWRRAQSPIFKLKIGEVGKHMAEMRSYFFEVVKVNCIPIQLMAI